MAAVEMLLQSGAVEVFWLAAASIGFIPAHSRAGAWRATLTVALATGVGLLWSWPAANVTCSVGAAIALSRMRPRLRPAWWVLAFLIGGAQLFFVPRTSLTVLLAASLGFAVGWWVLGGRHPATYAKTLPDPLPPGTMIRP